MRLCIIGYGNLGYHLLQALQNQHFKIQIVSKSSPDATNINPNVQLVRHIRHIVPCDIIVIALADHMITETAKQLCSLLNFKPLVIHLSGAKDLSCLDHFERKGFLWPLQTFRKETPIKNQDFPIFIGSNDHSNNNLIKTIAQNLSTNVHFISENQKLALHLSAVIANNFTNLNYTISKQILDREELSFDFLQSIIIEAARNAIQNNPSDVQTGPAFRGDKDTMNLHRNFIVKKMPELLQYYDLCSLLIEEKKQQHENY